MNTGSHTDVASLARAEQEFYDARTHAFVLLRKLIWRAVGEFRRPAEIYTLFDPRGKVILEYGCGSTTRAKQLLDRGAARVMAFDVSPTEVEAARERARAQGIADRTEFMVADAHALPFPPDSFELIVGWSILHHLDLRHALSELRRVLEPGGVAVFTEPLAHNPLLRLGRRLTPAARTPDEHPLTVDDWRLCASIFPSFRHREVEFLSVLLMPLNIVLPRRLQRRMAARVARLDDRLLARSPRLRRFARITFLVLQ